MDKNFIKTLKQNAHHLKPIILVGHKGITDALIKETHIALETHECIKVKISGWEKEDRIQMIQNLCQNLNATLIQSIGHSFVIYRKKNDDSTSK